MPGGEARAYEFADFRLYPAESLLLRNGHPVPLPPKSFQILCVLVEHHGHVVEKDALMHAVWPNTFVVESNLTYNISVLRHALAENGDSSHLIVTLPKRGYRFVGEARELQAVQKAEFGTSRGTLETSPSLPAIPADESAGKHYERQRVDAKIWWKPVGFSTLGVLLVALITAFIYFGSHTVTKAKPTRTIPAALSRRAALSKNAEANEFFERGVHVLERRSNSSGPKAVEALEQAVARDPGFALAYSHLAVAYIMKGDYLLAIQAARKAITLDDSLPEAHAAVGFVAMFRDWDWPTAERALRRAIQLDPTYARGHQWLSIWLELHRRIPEAESEMQRALELDPLSPIINSDLCQLWYYARKYEAAVGQCKKTIDLDPDFNATYGILELAYTALEKYDLAFAATVSGALRTGLPADSESIVAMREAFTSTGIRGVWRIQLHYQSRLVPPSGHFAARYYVRLGEIDHAFEALESGYLVHDFFMPFVNVDPVFDSVRSDPRYVDLARKMGLS